MPELVGGAYRRGPLQLFDVPERASIWGMEQIRRFVPGSTPSLDNKDALPFARFLADLDRSQEQLTTALALATPAGLTPTRQDKSIAEHLAFYAAHEAFHTGQIVIDLPAAGQPVTEPTTVGASVEVGSEIL